MLTSLVSGKISSYFWRREYQARGNLHVHGKYWSEEAPKFGEASTQTILNYITKFVTCTLPDPEYSPILYELVNKYQRHRCGPSCLRMIGPKSKI